MTSDEKIVNYYKYQPSHVLPAIFAAVVGVSFLLHIWQNFRYRFWRVTFFVAWGGLLFTIGWILRCFSSYHPGNKNLFIAQTVFIYLAPPVYSASAYNIVGRLMNYLPMHAPLNPNRVLMVFVYAGAVVEGITVAGAAKIAAAGSDLDEYKRGGVLVTAGLILQAVVETLVIMLVAIVHKRTAKARTIPRNVKILCMTLYGTSTFVLMRCIFRAVEGFEMFDNVGCRENCGPILSNEWYLYAFELGPMLIFTYWLNLLHPGRYLPRDKFRYLGTDGHIEREGPGWTDNRDTWATFMDPLDFEGLIKGKASHDQFWLKPEEWPACQDGSFAEGSASNIRLVRPNKENIVFASEA
ncbi:hypothetical protein N7462_010655 [Penicillium macrosclerotiorum]|uniref:uncharacterized protein n=1 Tax=Penicillium macrosclerotiorum TaxID=303699 RepID=UPI002547322A|nr:uncharacterized protein N7462_010655 [Penicillium macrosclerotiorum]KAJ5669585.1 hypothetical protein N7462_010655 [Penicillium macrosclerotiorum]